MDLGSITGKGLDSNAIIKIYFIEQRITFLVIQVWRWQIGVFLFWGTGILMFRKMNEMPKFSLSLPIASEFAWNFFTFIFNAFFFIVLHGVIFHLLLKNGGNVGFQTRSLSIMKTLL